MGACLMEWKPHSDKQERAVFSEAPIMLLGCGIQFGKTTVGAVRMKLAMHTYRSPDDAFLITAPNYKILQQSTLPAFLRVMEGCGTYNDSKATFTTHWGSKCYFRTATDPDSIVGITNIRHLWGDEAGKYGLYMWENMQARASFRQAPITLTTSPYALNWIFKEIIRPKMRDQSARPDCEWIAANSAENPYFPMAEYERKKLTMDPRRFNAVYGGKWEKMAGLVYDCFDDVENTCEPFTLPPGTLCVAGVDWGYTAPFVLTVRAITPNGKHFQVYEFYKSGCTLQQKIEVARSAKQVFGIKTFYCDPEDPASIASFNEAKLTAVPANNDVRAGIDVHYELIKSRDYKVFRGTSPHTLDEYEMYHWPEEKDLGPDQDQKEPKPVKQGDHSMDTNRYISLATRKGLAKRSVVVAEDSKAQEDQYKRLERLKRRQGRVNSEQWSA